MPSHYDAARESCYQGESNHDTEGALAIKKSTHTNKHLLNDLLSSMLSATAIMVFASIEMRSHDNRRSSNKKERQ